MDPVSSSVEDGPSDFRTSGQSSFSVTYVIIIYAKIIVTYMYSSPHKKVPTTLQYYAGSTPEVACALLSSGAPTQRTTRSSVLIFARTPLHATPPVGRPRVIFNLPRDRDRACVRVSLVCRQCCVPMASNNPKQQGQDYYTMTRVSMRA